MQLGRGDTKGALKGAIASFAACFVWIVLAAHRYPSGAWFFEWWQIILGRSAGLALQWWVLYMALEPYIRRTYPEALISWSRLVAGNLRNALVGRDILWGVGLGALGSAIALFAYALPTWFSIKNVTPFFIPDVLRPMSVYLGAFALQAGGSLINALGSLAIIFIAWKLFRSRTAGLIALGLFWTIIFLVPENALGELPFSVLLSLVFLACLIRTGLLGLIVAIFASSRSSWLSYNRSRALVCPSISGRLVRCAGRRHLRLLDLDLRPAPFRHRLRRLILSPRPQN